MVIVASWWWVWVIGFVVTMLYVGYNQVCRMNRIMTLEPESFLQGLFPFIVAAVLHLGFSVLLVTSIVLNVIDYAKK